jgi:hypothetical protein
MKHSTLLWSIFALSVVTSAAFAGTWSDPVLLTELNGSTASEWAYAPCLSGDGLTLYFGRRDLSSGYRRLYTASRDSIGSTFSNITMIDELASGNDIASPCVSSDGLRFYYGRYSGAYTLYQATRSDTSQSWQETLTFNSIHISGKDDLGPTLMADELTMFYISDRDNSNDDTRIWMATRSSTDEQFSNPIKITELDRGKKILNPCILPDGLTIYYAEKSNDQYDIFRATRNSINDPFSNIESIFLNTPLGIESSPYVTPDESEIFFVSPEGIWYTYEVPEPATLGLLALGAVLLRKRK